MISMKITLIGGIAILAIVGITVGVILAKENVDEPTCTGFNKPDQFRVMERDGKFFLVWSNPENLGDCTAKYRLTLSVNNDEAEEPKVVEANEYEIDSKFYIPCAKIHAEITTIDADNVESEKTKITYVMGVGIVSSVAVTELKETQNDDNTWTISWIKPTGYDYCDITYLVSVNYGKNEWEADTTKTISYDILRKCMQNVIVVMPIIQDYMGKSEVLLFEIAQWDVSTVKVTDLKGALDDDNMWRITWTRPSGYDDCIIKYNVKIIDGRNLEVDGTTGMIFNSQLKMCEENDISVTPVIKNRDGSPEFIKLVGDVGDFSKVTVTSINHELKGEDWIITWGKPEEYEKCDIKYIISIDTNNFGDEIYTEEIAIKNSMLNKCINNNIGVQPRVGSKLGNTIAAIIKGEPPIEGRITPESFVVSSTGDVAATWKKATKYQECPFKYSINIIKGDETITASVDVGEFTTTNTQITNCDEVTATVMAKMNNDGENVKLACTAPPPDSVFYFQRHKRFV